MDKKPDGEDWFEAMWNEEEKKDSSHRGISKERAKEVFKRSWQEMDDIFKSAEKKQRGDGESSEGKKSEGKK